MPIPACCPGCLAEYHLADRLGGRRVVCRSCQRPFDVPVPVADETRFSAVPATFAAATCLADPVQVPPRHVPLTRGRPLVEWLWTPITLRPLLRALLALTDRKTLARRLWSPVPLRYVLVPLLALLCLGTVTAYLWVKSRAANGPGGPPPAEWQLHDIAEALPGQFGTTKVTHILAWKVSRREAGDAVASEECLVLQEVGTAHQQQQWLLARPSRMLPDRHWNVIRGSAMMPGKDGGPPVCVSLMDLHRYETRPTNRQVYAFMDEIGWQLGPDVVWRSVRGDVCRETWRKVIGEEPTRFFAE